ncbi:TIGR04282 family arsenosugar biosynthesis glycosyltransferase [Neolewinella persica]|uniref:TIGR04282 family arsenosugar biosynthesis glycosyltransferase n=1 Tax=Neolewinella persica TaxID=70998 RepID=UPI00037B8D21|nr:DUF2064 domain-containing protein [Neolewinella persica]
MSASSTAILLFSRTASAEAKVKSFGAGQRGNSRIARGLIERTKATLAKTGLPVFRSCETNQVEGNFGQRLTNAMAQVYAEGFERVLVVGNDCPSVLPSHLRAAAQMLEQGQNVLGPDRRGGVWLIGLQRTDFIAGELINLSWETPGLYADMTAMFPEAIDFASLGDLNSLEDLRQNWFYLRRQLAELFDLLLISEATFATPVVQTERVAVSRRLGRAPPV